jgi:hypothetical protein
MKNYATNGFYQWTMARWPTGTEAVAPGQRARAGRRVARGCSAQGSGEAWRGGEWAGGAWVAWRW